MAEALVEGPQATDSFRDLLAHIYNNEAAQYGHRRKFEDAAALYQKALNLRQQLVKNNPDDDGYVTALARLEENLGHLAVDRGREDEARTWFETALAREEKLLEAPIYTLENKFYVALACRHLSNLERRAHNREAADNYLKKAIAHLREMRTKEPDVAQYPLELARCYANEADVLRDDGAKEKSLASYHRARELFESYVKLEPNVLRPQAELAAVLFQIARTQDFRDAPEDAILYYRKTIELRRRLLTANPKSTNYRMDLNGTLNNLASLLASLGQTDEALKLVEEAITLAQPVLKQHPNDLSAHRYLGNNYGVLGEVHRKAGRHKDALAAAEERRRIIVPIPDELLKSARDFAWVATPPKNPNGFSAEEKLAFSRAAERAVAVLQEAIQAGLRDRKQIDDQPAFKSLKNRSDFKEVMKMLP
jgi:tetratricopeptide (TPR) repeat protein